MYKHNVNNSMLMDKTGFGGHGILSLGKFRLLSGRAKKIGQQYRPVFKGAKIGLVFITGND